MKKYVAGFLFDINKEKVVLIKKNRPDWQMGFLNAVGGSVEFGESSLDAMKREFKEETNVEINDWEHFASVEKGDFIVDFFRAFSEKYLDVRSVTDEKVNIYEVKSISDLKIIDNLNWLIPLGLLSKNEYYRLVESGEIDKILKN